MRKPKRIHRKIVAPSKELSDFGKKWTAALNKTYGLNEEG